MKKIKAALAALTAVLTIGTAAFWSASAEETYDMDDVAQALREAVVPESQIQAIMNAYSYCEKDENGVYFGDDYFLYSDLVAMIEMLGSEGVNQAIEENLESGLAAYEQLMSTATTTTATTTGSGSDSSTTATTTTTAKTFAQMTMDEKIAYLYSLPEDERKTFMDNLSIAEKKSILLQMDADSKMEILDYLSQLMKELGFQLSVDDIQDNQIDLSVRDPEGNIIDQSSMGVVVEDTGWNLTGWFALASVLVLASMGGIAYVMYRSGKDPEEEQNG